MEITNSIKYVGVNDHEVDLFEGQYIVPNGMAYKSYVILDEKIAVMDTVDINFKDEWLSNIAEVLGDKKPDYLIVQTHGTRSLCKHQKLPGCLSGCNRCWECKDIYDDGSVLPA